MASVSNLEAMKSHTSIRNELRVSVVDVTEIDPETVVRELQKFLIKKKRMDHLVLTALFLVI